MVGVRRHVDRLEVRGDLAGGPLEPLHRGQVPTRVERAAEGRRGPSSTVRVSLGGGTSEPLLPGPDRPRVAGRPGVDEVAGQRVARRRRTRPPPPGGRGTRRSPRQPAPSTQSGCTSVPVGDAVMMPMRSGAGADDAAAANDGPAAGAPVGITGHRPRGGVENGPPESRTERVTTCSHTSPPIMSPSCGASELRARVRLEPDQPAARRRDPDGASAVVGVRRRTMPAATAAA